MINSVEALISNHIAAFSTLTQYAAILGENPSKGARSPLLWDAAYRSLGLSCRMLPMDVTPDKLFGLLDQLELDSRFVGGAVAVPHKESIARWLLQKSKDRLSIEAAAIGAVNSLYRDKAGQLCATNTDGEGALVSLVEKYPQIRGAKVTLIGPGGAGKAVAAFVSNAIGSEGQLTIAARQQSASREFAEKIGAILIAWPAAQKTIDGSDIIINCSTIGSDKLVVVGSEQVNLKHYTPLTYLNPDNICRSEELLHGLASHTTVFDIIYDPSPTKLLQLANAAGLGQIDGSRMNLEQAVLAFEHAVSLDVPTTTIRDAMQRAAVV